MNFASAVEAAGGDMTGGEIIGMFAIGFFVFGSIIAFIIFVTVRALRGDENAKRALDMSGNVMSKQLKWYGKSFKDGYNNGKNHALGALFLLAPVAGGPDVLGNFSNGIGQVLGDIWLVIAPYIAIAIILFVLFVAAKKFAGRQR